MDLMEAIRSRRAVRSYEKTPVPMEHIRLIVEAATWAPSGYNRQPWKFIAIQDPGLLAQLAEELHRKQEEIKTWEGFKARAMTEYAAFSNFAVFKEAPVAIAVLTTEYRVPIDEVLIAQGLSFEERFRMRFAPGIQCVAAAIQNMLLMATSLGYGTCYATGCIIAREGMENLLKVEPGWTLVAMVPVGIPKKRPASPRRKTVDEVLEVR